MKNMKSLKWLADQIETKTDATHLGWCLLSALLRAVEGEEVKSVEGLARLLADEAGVEYTPGGDFEY